MLDKKQVADLEVDLLLLYYTFSDQYGWVDVQGAQKWARQKLGVLIPIKPYKLEQSHIDTLSAVGAVPDISSIIQKMKT